MLHKIVGKFSPVSEPGQPDSTVKPVPGSTVHNEAFLRLNEFAPLASEVLASGSENDQLLPDASPHSQSIVCREAVLGGDQRVVGYSFMLRNRINERVRDSSTHVRSLYDEVLLRNLQAMQVQRLLEHRMAFIALAASSLSLPIVKQFPSEGTVYVVGLNDAVTANTQDIQERLEHLKSHGYQIAVHGTALHLASLDSMVRLADYLLVDSGSNEIPEIRNQLEFAGRLAPAIKFVATNIPSREDFNVCQRLPFSLFHGPFITHREEWNTRCLDAGLARTMMLLNKLRNDAELPEIVALIRLDPALVVRLIRYVNSPGMGLLQKVGTIEHALMALGRQKLYRWVTLLLFTGSGANAFMRPLLENALIRARLAELLSRDDLNSLERDELFLAGMVSLMDILMGLPMEAVLKQLGLPASFSEALLKHKGKFHPYLRLATACEKHDAEDVKTWATAIGLDEKTVNALHIEAMVWAQQAAD